MADTVVYDYVIPSGVITPDTTDIQDDVIAEFKTAFGADLITTANTPQGVLITAETLARDSVATNNATLANQINPNIAGGVFLDAIGALTGSVRNPEEFTLVTANLTGVAGTIINAGAQAQDSTTLEIYESLTTVTLAVDGTGSAVFRAINAGPIVVAAGDLDTIVSNVLGWETVTNPAEQDSVGSEEQSDAAFRELRKVTLASQGTALPEAIISGLYETDGVKSVAFRENIAATTEVIDGVTMVPHSIYACVDGGSDVDVANVLLAKKSGGCAYNNGPGINISETVVVPFSGQSMDILFDRPNLIPVYVRVTVKVGTSLVDPTTSVKDAIVNYANGDTPGEPGLIVGQAVSSFELAGAVNIENPGLYVKEVTTSTDGISFDTAEIAIGIFEKATITNSDISVTVEA